MKRTIALSIQYDLAWESRRQLQAEDVVVKGKRLTAEELLEKELPLKFVEVDEEQSRLVLSNRNAMADSQAQLGIGSVFTGTVQSLKPYGTFIDIGGINGLLHFCQISHDRVTDIATVFQPGDTLKVMILSHDRERGCISLSTKKLEPTPGEVIRNLKLVFKKVYFKERISSLLLATYVACHGKISSLYFSDISSTSTLFSHGLIGGGYGSNIQAEILNPSLRYLFFHNPSRSYGLCGHA